jgi:hypothetical protein
MRTIPNRMLEVPCNYFKKIITKDEHNKQSMGTNKAWEQTKHGNKQSMGTNKAWEQTTKHGNKQQSMGTNNKAWEQTTKHGNKQQSNSFQASEDELRIGSGSPAVDRRLSGRISRLRNHEKWIEEERDAAFERQVFQDGRAHFLQHLDLLDAAEL